MLGNVAVIAPDYRGAGLLIRPHHLAQLLRVELGREGRGAHQITEHHRQLATLGFASGGWRLGARAWGLGTRNLELGTWNGWLRLGGEGRAALGAELGSGQVHNPTTRTAFLQRSSTLDTELGSFRILRATARAQHTASLLLRAPRGKETRF